MLILKNFYRYFTKNILMVLGLVAMIVASISLLGGLFNSNNYATNQLAIMRNKHPISAYKNIELYNDSYYPYSESNFVKKYFNNLGYINKESKKRFDIDFAKLKNSTFRVTKDDNSNKYRFIVLDTNCLLDSCAKLAGSPDNNLQMFRFDPVHKYYYIPFTAADLRADSTYDINFDKLVEITENKALPLILFTSSIYDLANAQPEISRFFLGYSNLLADSSLIESKSQYDFAIFMRKLFYSVVTGSFFDQVGFVEALSFNDLKENISLNLFPSYIQDGYYGNPLDANGNEILVKEGEIYINPVYAHIRNIKIGDQIEIPFLDKQIRVAGFATNIFAIEYSFNSVGSVSTHLVGWINEDDYFELIHRLKGNWSYRLIDILVGGKYSDYFKYVRGKNPWYYSQMLNFMPSVGPESGLKFKYYHMLNSRISTMSSIFFSITGITIVASILMIFVIIGKIINSNILVIGNLKAQGLRSFKIILPLSFLFFVIFVISMALAFGFSLLFAFFLTNSYVLYVPLLDFGFFVDFNLMMYLILIPLVGLTLLTIFYIAFLIRKRPLKMLQADRSDNSSSVFSRFDLEALSSALNVSFKHKITLKLINRSKIKILVCAMVALMTSTILFIIPSTFSLSYKLIRILEYDVKVQRFYNSSKDFVIDKPTDTDIALVDFNNANNSVHEIQSINELFSKLTTTGIKNNYFKAQLIEDYANSSDPHLPYQKQVADFYNKHSYLIHTIAQNDGNLTFGFQFYDEQNDVPVLDGPLALSPILSLEQFHSVSIKDSSAIKDVQNRSNGLEIRAFSREGFEKRLINISTNRYINFDNFFGLEDNWNTPDYKKYEFQKFILNYINKDSLEVLYMLQSEGWQIQINPVIASKPLQKYTWDPGYLYYSTNELPDQTTKIAKLNLIVANQSNLPYSFSFSPASTFSHFITDKTTIRYNTIFSRNYDNMMLKNFGIFVGDNSADNYKNIDGASFMNILSGSLTRKDAYAPYVAFTSLISVLVITITLISAIASFVQILITSNMILKDNMNIINLLKAMGYRGWWVFNRVFAVYIPVVLLAWGTSIPLGFFLTDIYSRVVAETTTIYIPIFARVINYFLSLAILYVIFVVGFVVMYLVNKKRYPIYRFTQD